MILSLDVDAYFLIFSLPNLILISSNQLLKYCLFSFIKIFKFMIIRLQPDSISILCFVLLIVKLYISYHEDTTENKRTDHCWDRNIIHLANLLCWTFTIKNVHFLENILRFLTRRSSNRSVATAVSVLSIIQRSRVTEALTCVSIFDRWAVIMDE